MIQVDYKGDGSSTASQTVAAAGQYSFTSPALPDGSYTAKVTFTPSDGGAAVAASVGYTIDTKAPTLVPGASTAQGPLYSRTLTFSKNIDAATIGVSSIAISGPGITGSIQPASVIGSGTTYVVTFAAPLTQGGAYTLRFRASIADLAGNTIGSGVVDQFQLTPDTTLPVVSAVTPSGLTNRRRVEPERHLQQGHQPEHVHQQRGDASAGPAVRFRPARSRSPRSTPHTTRSRFPPRLRRDVQRQHRRAGRARHLRQRDGCGLPDQLHHRSHLAGGCVGQPERDRQRRRRSRRRDVQQGR